MLGWKDFRNTVVSVIATMDCIETCRLGSILDTMTGRGGINFRADASEVLVKMERSGLLMVEENGRDSLISITAKGRELAKDIRTLAEKAVKL